MKLDFYPDFTDFAIGFSLGKSHKCSGYHFNLSISITFFMVVLRFRKVRDNNKIID